MDRGGAVGRRQCTKHASTISNGVAWLLKNHRDLIGARVLYSDDNGQVQDKASNARGYPPPPLDPEIMRPLQSLVARDWPGLRVVPNMSVGPRALASN
jgi:hypothetical protein